MTGCKTHLCPANDGLWQRTQAMAADIQCGYRQMQGHLTAQGIRVQQGRVRESQRRVDPGGCIMRRLSSINCRVYRVNGPLAQWHIDGNHKLIRWVKNVFGAVNIIN